MGALAVPAMDTKSCNNTQDLEFGQLRLLHKPVELSFLSLFLLLLIHGPLCKYVSKLLFLCLKWPLALRD